MLRLFAQYKAVQSSVQELIRSLRIEGLERFTQIVPVGWNITRVWFPSPSPFWQHFCVPRSMFHFKVPSVSGITEVAFYLSPIKCESTSPSWSDNTEWPRQVRELIHDLDRNGIPQENGSKGTCSPCTAQGAFWVVRWPCDQNGPVYATGPYYVAHVVDTGP